MARIEQFEDIKAWQKAQELVLGIYASLKDCRDFSFRDQIQRAAISIMNNIAEGYEKKGDREFQHFLYIAKGSCSEVRSMLSIADKLGYMSKQDVESFSQLSVEVTKMLSAFIKHLNQED